MKKSKHRLSRNIVLLPSLVAAAVAANVAHAQEQEDKMQEVVVTGSRIIQTGVNAQSPISIINRDAIDKTGLASVGDLL
jgi:iron complex outermembrane receptor protein